MVSEDFSFPKLTNFTPQFTFSPSLWRASSLVFPSLDDKIFFNNSQEEADPGRNSSVSCPETTEEDKMDMLWEDFNDRELPQRVCSKEKNKKGEAKGEKLGERDKNMVVEICCAEALKISKRGTGGGIIQNHQRKRRNMGVFVKFLIRKLFSTNKSSRRLDKDYCLWPPHSGI